MEPKWGKMFLFSACFHAAVFAGILFVPESSPSRRPMGDVVQVDLVQLPPAEKPALTAPAPAPKKPAPEPSRPEPIEKRPERAKRIQPAKPPETKPAVIAERTLKRKTRARPKPRKPAPSPSRRIDRAVSKLERQVKTEQKSDAHLDRALAQLQTRQQRSGPGGAPAEGGIRMRMYQLEVEDRIKGNWTYPALMNGEHRRGLEAVVVLKVFQDGRIAETQIRKASSNAVFDQSVLKAVERSNPLPGFPEGYEKSEEEFVITFNLQDLEAY